MSVTPSLARAAHTMPTNEPFVAIDAFALARSLMPIATPVSLRALIDPAATTNATRTMAAIRVQRMSRVTEGLLVTSEGETHAELQRSRIAHCGNRIEVGNGVRPVRSGREGVVSRDVVHPVRDVERFDQALGPYVASNAKGATHAKIQREEVASPPRISRDELDCANIKVRRGDRAAREGTTRRSLQVRHT